MSALPNIARLADRATIRVTGEDWRGFLQGLITQDVEALAPGELRYGALLTPQGRLLFDLFLLGEEGGALIDCDATRREALVARLSIYRLRAKVTISPIDAPVFAAWGAEAAPAPWIADPRLRALGFRAYASLAETGADYDAHRLALGVPASVDFGDDATYPIEADVDLLNGIDFQKGCFVGQETTSRMKRRGVVKSRMVPIAWIGDPPRAGQELLCGDLRAGTVTSAGAERAMALLRLDRIEGNRSREGGSWRPVPPAWLGIGDVL